MRTVLRGGMVLTLDPELGDFPQADVLIEDGRIAAIGPVPEAVDAEEVDAAGKIVLPGFVDVHRHTWQTAFRGIGANWTFSEYRTAMHGTLRPHYRPEDVYLGNLLGRLEALNSGITTMLDWFHCSESPEHADSAVDALADAPGHSIFCYCASEPDVAGEMTRIRKRLSGDQMAFGLRGPFLTTMDETAADVALARELDLRVSVHLHTRVCDAATEMHQRNLLDNRTTIVHGNGLSDAQLAFVADAGCSVTVSPDVELKMGFGWPETGRLLAAGIRPALSVDDCPSAGGDLFSAMRTAFAAQRGLDGSLTARDVLEFATVDGARACGRADRTGTLAIGKDADLILLDAEDLSVFPVGDPVSTVVTAGHPGLVDSVYVAGRAVKRNGQLLNVDPRSLRARLLASRDRIAAAAGFAITG